MNKQTGNLHQFNQLQKWWDEPKLLELDVSTTSQAYKRKEGKTSQAKGFPSILLTWQ